MTDTKKKPKTAPEVAPEITTNQVQICFDITAIERDFVIFSVWRDKGCSSSIIPSIIPDVALQQGKALAVVYDDKQICYILYKRKGMDIDKDSLKQMLEKYDKSVQIKEIAPSELESHRLAQLLCNAIPMLLSDYKTYHNITGRLYYRESEWTKHSKGKLISFWVLQISFTQEHCIKMNVRTFSDVQCRREWQDKPQYLFDPKTYVLRRALKEERRKTDESDERDPCDQRFVIAALSRKHKNTIPFLDFASLDKYQKCKVGILQRFQREVETLLKPYLTLTPITLNTANHRGAKKPKKNMNIERIRQRLKQCPLYWEDTVDDDQSHALIEKLKDKLAKYSGIILQQGPPCDNAALIRIIHNKEYFDDTPECDTYGGTPKNCAVQHITVEDFLLSDTSQNDTTEKEDPGLSKVIQELAIKLDVRQGRMQCYDWSDLRFPGAVTFVTASQKLKENGNDKDKLPCYQRLRVMPDGELCFDAWKAQEESSSLFTDSEDPEKEQIAAAFRTDQYEFDRQVEGVVYEDVDHMHVIRNTDLYTLPDMKQLEETLSKTRDKEQLPVDPIKEVIEGVLDGLSPKETKERKHCQDVLEKMKKYEETISRKDMRHILNLKMKLGRTLNEQINQETGILIGSGMKQGEKRESIFGGVLDIRQFQEGDAQYYYSSISGASLNHSLPHACRIRKVTSTGETLEFERYLPLLEVDFVRANGWTVIPFPFKYLREWAKLQPFDKKSAPLVDC